MGVRYFNCKGCGNPSSEFDEIVCEDCHGSFCSCAVPDELKEFISCWDEVWRFVSVDEENNLVSKPGHEDTLEVFKKYLNYNGDTYGLVLRKEYCPRCSRAAELAKDPEYKEYLRLKEKFCNA